MSKQILVNSSHYETRVATLENGEIRQLHIERKEDRNVVGNIYKGLVKRVLPGMQAAFLELGLERTAFLYVDDIVDDPFGSDVDIEDEMEEDDGTGPYGEPRGGDLDEEEERALVEGDEHEEYRAEAKPKAPPRESEREPASPQAGQSPERPLERSQERAQDTPQDRPQDRTTEARQSQAQDDDYRNEDDYDDREDYQQGEDDREFDDRDADREGNREGGSREGNRDQNRDPQREGGGGQREFFQRGSGGGRDYQGHRGDRDSRDRQNRGGRGGRDRGGRGRRPQRRGRHQARRQRGTANIQDLLKEGQEILVQVAKAPIGTKGARLTTHISLPGRNLVLMPTVRHLGISRRIGSDRERRRLRDLFMNRIRPKGVGFIIRTVAEGKSLRDIKADADYLIQLWQRVKRDAARKKAPALIHEDLSLGLRAVRDFFTDEVDTFIIDNAAEYETVLNFIGHFMPRLKNRVKLFKGPSQLFEHYGIEAEISRALGKKVWLKSGGYLLIDQSEALTAIDVNTGRYVGSKSLEETIFKTNLEAVKEVAYQLRIRNVGGIIIIDLIDMENHENREKVYQALQEALGEDRARTNILKISDLGLVEMTRKRTHEDLVRYLTEACSNCDGRGYHKSRRTVCFEIFREIEKEALGPNKNIVVFAHPDVTSKLREEEFEHVEKLEARFDRHITIKTDPAFHVEQYEVFGKS